MPTYNFLTVQKDEACFQALLGCWQWPQSQLPRLDRCYFLLPLRLILQTCSKIAQKGQEGHHSPKMQVGDVRYEAYTPQAGSLHPGHANFPECELGKFATAPRSCHEELLCSLVL